MDPAQAWLLALASMTLVFLAVYWREGNAQRALLYSLILGKLYAGVFWLLHIDWPVLAIYRYVPGYGYYPVHVITANMVIFLLFLSSALTTLFWQDIQREMRRELRRALKIT
ncbi:MAG: hypothetical protein LRS46_03130 [Desulfurococcales archaeon]|nr:hypothetical protein [Desulfurococcales archaeon]